MIAVPVEPSRLGFESYQRVRGAQGASIQAEEFITFVAELRSFLADLRKANLKIAMSHRVWELIHAQVPYQFVPSDNPSLMRLVNEAFSSLLPQYITPVSVDEDIQVSFRSGLGDAYGLLDDDELYKSWSKSLGLILKDQLPEVILRSPDASIFHEPVCEIEDAYTALEKACQIASEVRQAERARTMARYRLAALLETGAGSPSVDVPCRGTGTHSSMWGTSIRSLTDVPEPERSLLSAVISTGLVEEIVFLEFDQAMSRRNPPELLIKVVRSLDKADELDCVLVGQGKKQNAQRVVLRLRPGTGALIKDALGGRITEGGLAGLTLKLGA